jgi:hypothetical protein
MVGGGKTMNVDEEDWAGWVTEMAVTVTLKLAETKGGAT